MASNANLVERHANVMVNIRRTRYMAIIPTCIDQNPWAHLRCPMDMIVHG
jgi:hypothetical protein